MRFKDPQVGYYGGIDYGYGYGGNGYDGGRWQGDRYSYNTAYSNVDRNDVRSVYVDRRGTGKTWDRRSYNGGNGGVTARPTRSQVALARERRIPATSVQLRHQRIAATNRLSFASANHGRPALAAVARPLAARTAPVHVAAKHVAPVPVAAFRPHVAAVHPATHDAPAHVAASHYAPVHAAVPHYAPVHAAVPHYAPVHAAVPHYAPAPRAVPAHAVAPAHAAPPPERHHETH